MQHRPLSTRAIQGARALNYAPDERWVDWAVRLLTEGADTPNLRTGLRPPCVPALAPDEAVDAFAQDLVAALLRNHESTQAVLLRVPHLTRTR